MSEFKYACPVCGQHMKCDSSQAGSVMDCPTCFQKIVAPQAPAADSRLILTGTKFAEKKKSSAPGQVVAASATATKKPMLLALVIVLALAAAGAGIFVFRAKIFQAAGGNVATNETASAPAQNPAPKTGTASAGAPPAKNSNWTLDLGAAVIPEAPAAGRVHGRDFVCERAIFASGILTLRMGPQGGMDLGVVIGFGGATAQALAGQTIQVAPDADKAAKVVLRWKDSLGKLQQASYANRYAMRLEFGALAGGKLPGKIYLCTPDAEKSYLLGTFTAEMPKPKAKARAPKK